MKSECVLAVLLIIHSIGHSIGFAEEHGLVDSRLFYASFDRSADADFAKGEASVFTGSSLKREKTWAGVHTDAVRWQSEGGRQGGGLQFLKKSPQLVFFQGGKNLPSTNGKFAGTVSLWMKVSPSEDLPKGFVDPLQITDKAWNNASFFIDFDQDATREFRLGSFSDFEFWNPTKRKFDDIPRADRPMVFVTHPPFTRDRWCHVAFTWTDFNIEGEGEAILYIDGVRQGAIGGQQRFTWQPKNTVIMLGINYVGWVDDLAIYDRALSPLELKAAVAW